MNPDFATVRRSLFVALLAYLFTPNTAVCLDIQLNFLGDFQQRRDAITAMERAATIWETVLVDPVTVHIDVSEEFLGFAQGGTLVNWYEEMYPLVRDALVADASSADDVQSLAHLPAGPQMSFRSWDSTRTPIINEGNDHIHNYVLMPRANLKAAGLIIEEEDPDADAEIIWNAWFLDGAFDFDRYDGVVGTDFVGVAVHEIGHALGFTSGVDQVDGVFAGLGAPPEELNDYSIVTMLDLFRYTADSAPLPDLTPGGSPYFSIDGGETILGSFANGFFHGDTGEASHWVDGQGIMDAFGVDDTIQDIRQLDLRAMDVIGWDLVDPADFDFDQNGVLDVDDADQLVSAIVDSNPDPQFDLSGDSVVDDADLTRWLALAARENGFIAPYLFGDANLDGAVNASDLNALAQDWLGDASTWQSGDFNADGIVDAIDLNKIGINWQQSIPMAATQSVPEPSSILLLFVAGLFAVAPRFRNSLDE